MRRFCAWILCGLVCSAASHAAAPAPFSPTLDDCIQMALERNLELQIQRINPEISGFILAGSYSAYDPSLNIRAVRSFNSSPGPIDPTTGLQLPASETETERVSSGLSGQLPTGLSYDLSANIDRSTGSRFTTGPQFAGSGGVSLRQPLLKNSWIDSTRMQIQLNKRNLSISELALRFQVMNVVTRVQEAYYNLVFAQNNVQVQEKALELAERLLAENRKRVEVGALAPLDEKQAESQVAARRADLLTGRSQLAAQQNVLKNLVADDIASWQGRGIEPAEPLLAVAPSLDLQESWRQALTRRPDILQLKEDLEKRDIVLRFAFNQLFPSLDLVGSYGHNALDSSFGRAAGDIRKGEDEFYSYGAVLTIPLSNRDARYRHRANKAEKQQALLRYKKLEQDIIVQVDDAVKLAQTTYERVDATRQARLFAEAALDAEERKLASGKSTSFVVLQLQRDLTNARSAEIRALADYNIALARLALSEGATLERAGVELDVR